MKGDFAEKIVGGRIVPAEAAAVGEAAAILRAGGLVAFPTETVYGLGADATQEAAVARIYAAKGRPAFNPLIAHVENLEAARAQGLFSAEARKLASLFWPGPLTLVLPLAATATVCALVRAGKETIALRTPSHPIALALIEATGRPLAAPSANRSGHISPVAAAHVAQDLGSAVDLILDAGPCPLGLESTIIACLEGPPRLLRPGGLSREAIEDALGVRLDEPTKGKVEAPGMLASHYAPRARLRLDARTLAEDEAGLDFGGIFPCRTNVLDLSPGRDLEEAAANLYSFLRLLDAHRPRCIAVAPVPKTGLGAAINDRLARAAAPRACDPG